MRRALVVGINKYPGSPLFGCVNDANDFKKIIETNEDGSPNFDVRVEENIGTKAELKAKIAKLFAAEADMSLLYFSGHGIITELGGYIMTPDYKSYDEGVSMDEILNLANESRAKDRIIFLDCCHAGAMGSPAVMGGSSSMIKSGVSILSASRSDETSMEFNGHGVFTSLLLDGLSGGAADLCGNITAANIYTYIDQALGAWHQRPVFKTNITRFTSLRNVKPQVPKEILRLLVSYFPVPEAEYKLDRTYEYTNKKVAIEEKVVIFKNLQRLTSVGLIVPVGEEHMYWAAQNGKSCRLTALGYHYWRLVKEGRL